MNPKSKNNLIAYGILTGVCLTVAFIAATHPELFAHGPPSFRLFLSIPGTAVIALLGLIGILFLNPSTLRGLWDDDLTARQKVLLPSVVGIAFGGLNVLLRRVIPIDAAITTFAQSQGIERIAPSLAGAILGYGSGGILINIVYFLILIPSVVYLVSDRLLNGQKQAIVFWSIAAPLALWEPIYYTHLLRCRRPVRRNAGFSGVDRRLRAEDEAAEFQAGGVKGTLFGRGRGRIEDGAAILIEIHQ